MQEKYENWSSSLIEPTSLNISKLFALESRVLQEENIRLQEMRFMQDTIQKLLYTLHDDSRFQQGSDQAFQMEKSLGLDFKLPEMDPSSTITTAKGSRCGSDLNRPNQRRLLNQSVVLAKNGMVSPNGKAG